MRVRVIRVLMGGGLLLAALVGYAVLVMRTGRGIPCLLHLLTGLECGSCGITRALVSALRLDFSAAFSYNLLWPLFPAWFLWVAVADVVAYLRRGTAPLLPGKPWVHLALLAAVILYGVLRNLL